MDADFLVGALTGPVVMAVIAGIARAAAAGRIRRNHAVGLRLPSMLASDAAWRAGHRAAVVPATWWTAVLLVLAGVALPLRAHGFPSDGLTVALLVLLAVAVAWVVIVSTRSARAAL